MRKVLLSALCMISLALNAQSLVSFHINESGTFLTDEGKDYVVIPFEGKTAHEIFQQLTVNVNAIYKNPSKVMSVVEDASVTIRGYESELTWDVIVGKKWVGGYYNLNFQIKDGRVRVAAPIIDDDVNTYINNSPNPTSFISLIRRWFKNGVPKEKAIERIEYLENNLNNTINAVLYYNKTKATEEEW